MIAFIFAYFLTSSPNNHPGETCWTQVDGTSEQKRNRSNQQKKDIITLDISVVYYFSTVLDQCVTRQKALLSQFHMKELSLKYFGLVSLL